MKDYGIIEEGMIEGPELSLYNLRTKPKGKSEGRILFLGGSNFDLRLKRQFLNSSLLNTYEVATFEPRGIGRSHQPEGVWTMQDYATDAFAYMEVIGWDSAHIIGESFGGMTALHMVVIQPKKIESLTLTSTTSGGAGGSSFDIGELLSFAREEAAAKALELQDRRMLELKETAPDSYRKKLEERIAFETAFVDPSVASGGYRRLLEVRNTHNVWDKLPDINCPTLVVAGAHDGQADPVCQKKMAQELGNSEFWLRPGGHGLLFGVPDLAAEIEENWLRKLTVEVS